MEKLRPDRIFFGIIGMNGIECQLVGLIQGEPHSFWNAAKAIPAVGIDAVTDEQRGKEKCD